MQWLIGSAALILSIILAFRYSESRRTLLATLGIIAILAGSAATLFVVEMRQSAERRETTTSRVTPGDILISGANLDYDYGRWRVSGRLTNNATHNVISLGLHVTVKDCPGGDPCKVTGDTEATHYGIDVPPGETRPFDMLLYLPDTPKPKLMKWEYRVMAVGAAR